MNDVYQFYENGRMIGKLDMSDWQCSGISGRLPVSESCGGCVGCLLAQALHAGWHDFENEIIDNKNITKMIHIGEKDEKQ